MSEALVSLVKRVAKALEDWLKEQEPPPPPPSTEYMPSWDKVKDIPFGRYPYVTSSYKVALFCWKQQAIWDGVRNPSFALRCSKIWPYNGVTAERAKAFMAEAQAAIDQLEHFILLDPYNEDVAHSGTWLSGKTRRENFERWYKEQMVPVHNMCEKLNGCKGEADRVCP